MLAPSWPPAGPPGRRGLGQTGPGAGDRRAGRAVQAAAGASLPPWAKGSAKNPWISPCFFI